MYSLTDDQTLEEIRAIHEQVLNVHPNKQVPIILIANKLDLAAEDRAVSTEEGGALADEINAAGFMEVSAKQNMGVKQAFEMLLKKIIANDDQAGAGDGRGFRRDRVLPWDRGGVLRRWASPLCPTASSPVLSNRRICADR